MDFKLNTKGLERESLIDGVRHFDTREDAMLYAQLKYGADFEKISTPDVHAYYKSSKFNPETGKTLLITTPVGEWQDDHDVLVVRQQWEDKDGWHDDIIEFCTYAEGYTYSYRYSREYDYIQTV